MLLPSWPVNICIMSDSTPVKNRLIPAGAQMMSAWLINDGCDFMKFVYYKCDFYYQ